MTRINIPTLAVGLVALAAYPGAFALGYLTRAVEDRTATPTAPVLAAAPAPQVICPDDHSLEAVVTSDAKKARLVEALGTLAAYTTGDVARQDVQRALQQIDDAPGPCPTRLAQDSAFDVTLTALDNGDPQQAFGVFKTAEVIAGPDHKVTRMWGEIYVASAQTAQQKRQEGTQRHDPDEPKP